MMLSWRSWRGEVGLKWCQNECEGKERLKNIGYFFGGDWSTPFSTNSQAHDSSTAAFVSSFPSCTTHTHQPPLPSFSSSLQQSQAAVLSVSSLPDAAAVVKQRERRERERRGLERAKEKEQRRGDSGKTDSRGLDSAVIYPKWCICSLIDLLLLFPLKDWGWISVQSPPPPRFVTLSPLPEAITHNHRRVRTCRLPWVNMPHTFTHTYMQKPTRNSGVYAHTCQDFYKHTCRNTRVRSHTYITHRSDDCRGHEGSQPDAPLETVN